MEVEDIEESESDGDEDVQHRGKHATQLAGLVEEDNR